MTKNKIYSLITIVVIAIIGIGLFISCKEDENTQLYNNKSVVQEPTIDLKLINEINNDSSFWIGYGTFHDKLLWTSKKENNNSQIGIYYNYNSFGESILTRISESVFEFYDPFYETTSVLENIIISEDKLSLTADYILDNVRYTIFYKDNLNKYDIFEIPIGEKIVLSEANFNAKVPWVPILKGLYHLIVVTGVAVYKACDDAIRKDELNCAKKGCDSEVQAGCWAKCINCPPPK